MYLDKYRLDGKTAFITGGGRGIGLASAQALAEAGAAIIIADRDETILRSGEKELTAKGHKVEAIVLDVTRPDDVTRAADHFNADGRAVDILIANAGIAWPDTGGEEMSDEVWLKVVDVDLNGVFWSCRAFGRHMLARQGGAIVTTGSMSGVIANKPQRQAHYNAAKAGVHQPHQVAGRRVGAARRAGEFRGAGLYRDGDVYRPAYAACQDLAGEHADAPPRPAGRDRLGDPVPGLAGIEPADRLDRDRRRRLLHLVVSCQLSVVSFQ